MKKRYRINIAECLICNTILSDITTQKELSCFCGNILLKKDLRFTIKDKIKAKIHIKTLMLSHDEFIKLREE